MCEGTTLASRLTRDNKVVTEVLPGAGAKSVGWPHVRLLYCISVLSFVVHGVTLGYLFYTTLPPDQMPSIIEVTKHHRYQGQGGHQGGHQGGYKGGHQGGHQGGGEGTERQRRETE